MILLIVKIIEIIVALLVGMALGLYLTASKNTEDATLRAEDERVTQLTNRKAAEYYLIQGMQARMMKSGLAHQIAGRYPICMRPLPHVCRVNGPCNGYPKETTQSWKTN